MQRVAVIVNNVERRVERARQLLLDTDLTIPQIATASGFSSASCLTVVFAKNSRRNTGGLSQKYLPAWRHFLE